MSSDPASSPKASGACKAKATPKAKAAGKAKAKAGARKVPDPKIEEDQAEDEDEDVPQTLAAKKHRLRRICERKPSGKLRVPESVHNDWALGGPTRDALLEKLAQSGWKRAPSLELHAVMLDLAAHTE